MGSEGLILDGDLLANFRVEVDEWIYLGGYHTNDEDNLVNYLSDLTIYQNTLNIPFPYGYDDAIWWFTHLAEEKDKLGFLTSWTIRHQADGLIGSVSMVVKDGGIKSIQEIGYWLAYPYRRQGIMTAVINAFSSFCFDQYDMLEALCAHVYTFNIASQSTLLKAGFERGKLIPNYYEKHDKKLDAIQFVLKKHNQKNINL